MRFKRSNSQIDRKNQLEYNETMSAYKTSVYARSILSDWPIVASLFSTLSERTKGKVKLNETSQTALLTDQQIESVMEGPYALFLREKLQAYVLFTRVRIEHLIVNEQIFKEIRGHVPNEYKISETKIKELNNEKLHVVEKELNKLTSDHFNQLQEWLTDWQHQLIDAFNANGLNLSDIEINDLKDQEPYSAIEDRFVNLNIQLPKLKKGEMNFSKFLKLKADLAAHSALSRQHKPHQQADIDKILKKIKKVLDLVESQEKQLLAEFKKATELAVKSLSFAKAK